MPFVFCSSFSQLPNRAYLRTVTPEGRHGTDNLNHTRIIGDGAKLVTLSQKTMPEQRVNSILIVFIVFITRGTKDRLGQLFRHGLDDLARVRKVLAQNGTSRLFLRFIDRDGVKGIECR